MNNNLFNVNYNLVSRNNLHTNKYHQENIPKFHFD